MAVKIGEKEIMKSEKYSEEKINFFWHNGKKILIKPVGMPVNFIADYKLRFYIAWHAQISVCSAMNVKERRRQNHE